MQTEKIKFRGVTRTPNDTACQNGDLALAVDVALDADGIKTLERPAALFTLRPGETVLCVHQNDNFRHYITVLDNTLYWYEYIEGDDDWTPVTIGDAQWTITAATTLGNVVITHGARTLYFIWNNRQSKYLTLGEHPPVLNIRFGLQSELNVYPGMADSSNAAEPAEFWGWWYTEDVPLPWVAATDEDTHAYRTRMEGSQLKTKSYYIDTQIPIPGGVVSLLPVVTENPDMWDFSLKDKISTSQQSESKIDEFVGRLTEFVMAKINRFVGQKGTAEGKFSLPFFIRYCYELYDGSQIMQSDPVLMLPNTMGPMFLADHDKLCLKKFDLNGDHEKVAIWIKGRVWGMLSKITYTIRNTQELEQLRNWEDLIKSVGIYITPQIYPYQQDGKVYGWYELLSGDIPYLNRFHQSTQGIGWLLDTIRNDENFNKLYHYGETQPPETDNANGFFALRLPDKEYADIRKEISNAGQFYKLCEISFDELMDFTSGTTGHTIPNNAELPIDKNTLNTLTNQRQLGEDYIGSDSITAKVMHVYNRRLNIGNVRRTYAPPYELWAQIPIFTGTGNQNPMEITEAVEILNEQKNIIYNNADIQIDGNTFSPLFLYHADPNARNIYLGGWHTTTDGTKNYKIPLSKHKSLPGNFWLAKGLYTINKNDLNQLAFNAGEILPDAQGIETFPEEKGGTEVFEGEVWTSESENPFTFKAANINQVGDGIIKALCPAVAPLAEDQHGYAPLYVMTSQGIWAITNSKDGTPAAIDHICGDIITDNTTPISVGQSCLMMSQRGLLELSGRRVRNLSDALATTVGFVDISSIQAFPQLVGKAGYTLDNAYFDELAKPLRGTACKMAYDYEHARVYVFLQHATWVLNLKSGLWSQSSTIATQVFNAYPECEFQLGDNIMRMTDNLHAEQGLVFTRPIKLTEHLQVIRELVLRGNTSPNLRGDSAFVWTTLHGARNGNDYGLIASSQADRIVGRIGGSPYRTHIIGIIIRDSSTVIDSAIIGFDTEQTDKIR